ncbi:hypothetical protein BDW69DRAFT_23153 [Aspergillus filifer]
MSEGTSTLSLSSSHESGSRPARTTVRMKDRTPTISLTTKYSRPNTPDLRYQWRIEAGPYLAIKPQSTVFKIPAKHSTENLTCTIPPQPRSQTRQMQTTLLSALLKGGQRENMDVVRVVADRKCPIYGIWIKTDYTYLDNRAASGHRPLPIARYAEINDLF